jgi:hypothetical protein
MPHLRALKTAPQAFGLQNQKPATMMTFHVKHHQLTLESL